MSGPTSRVLRLLGLLESRPVWSGPELAARLEITERTLRRDMTRLRELGYRIDGVQGVEGGYRLAGGHVLPPLVLDDDEAVALVACLRMAALDGADDVGEAALRALAKLDPILPAQVQAHVRALDEAVVSLPAQRPQVPLTVLLALARAQRDRRLVRFMYARADATSSERTVEPVRLLTSGRLWYVVAYDRGREDWRTFRLDRISEFAELTFVAPAREVPASALEFTSQTEWPYSATVTISATAEAITTRMSARYYSLVGESADGCTLHTGAGNAMELAWHLAWVARDLDAELRVVEGEDLRTALAQLGADLTRYAE